MAWKTECKKLIVPPEKYSPHTSKILMWGSFGYLAGRVDNGKNRSLLINSTLMKNITLFSAALSNHDHFEVRRKRLIGCARVGFFAIQFQMFSNS